MLSFKSEVRCRVCSVNSGLGAVPFFPILSHNSRLVSAWWGSLDSNEDSL